ncbi:hypothetical protein ACUSIJ_24735 [Pseudochelatococcus sp. B33]
MARRHFRKPARNTVTAVILETAKTQRIETPAFWNRVASELGVDRDQLSDLIDEYGIIVPVRPSDREAAR